MYAYSASNNMFYPVDMQDIYELAGTWPVDGVNVDDDIFIKYTSQPPEGKIRIAGADGLPAWGGISAPTKEQLIQQAEKLRTSLLAEANNEVADWRTELSLGIISDADKASLVLWMQYIKAVKAVDTSTAPAITWPTKPE